MPHALQSLSWIQWLEPLVLVINLAIVALYLALVKGPLKRYVPDSGSVRPRQVASFCAAMGLLYLAFGGPLDILGDRYLFSAHMTQHLLETMGAAPLFLLGMPDWLVRSWLRHRPTAWVLRAMTRPMLSGFVFAAVMALTVWPLFYDLIVTNSAIHLAYHAALFVTAVAAWWPYLSPLPEMPRLHPGLQMLFITASGLPMLLIFVPILLDTTPYYQIYVHAPRVWGLSPVADQQLGAAIMLVGMHISAGIIFISAFLQWGRRERIGTVDIEFGRLVPWPYTNPGTTDRADDTAPTRDDLERFEPSP